MRIARGMIVGLLALTAAPLADVLSASTPASAANGRTLTTTPSHGTYGAPFTVEYREPAGLLLACSSPWVSFTFDGATLGKARLQPQNGECVATLGTAPPKDRSDTSYGKPGPHTVGLAGDSLATTYTIDPAPSATATDPVPAAPAPTKAAPSLGSVAPSTVPASPASAAAHPVGPPATRTAIGMPGPASGYSAMPLILAGLGIGVVIGVGVLGLLLLSGRRGPRATAEPRRPSMDGQPGSPG